MLSLSSSRLVGVRDIELDMCIASPGATRESWSTSQWTLDDAFHPLTA
jgi:hypothetical protein